MKNERFVTGIYGMCVIVIDLILVFMSIYLSFMLKFNFNPPSFNYDPFITVSPIIAVAYLIFMHVFNMDSMLKQAVGELIYSIFLTIIALLVATMAINFFLRTFSYPRSVMIMSSVMQFVSLSLWRTLVWKLTRKSHGAKPTMIIGTDEGEHLAKKLIIKQRDIYNVKYIYSSMNNNIWNDILSVEVVFLSDDVKKDIKEKILDICLCRRISVYIVPGMYEIALLNSKLNRVDDIPVLKVKKLGLTVEQRFIKRLIDIVVSLVSIIILSPVMLIISLAIAKDKGPVLYKQERVTEGDRVFNVIKFRSMVVNAEKLTGPVFAGEEDKRITKVGRILRATRLDELPQLFNILAGDMSLVGPRPERPFFTEQFKREISEYKYRTTVKAGLTGMAQILGKYNTTANDKARYDILYIKNYSILLDFKLILQTIKIVFMKESTEGIKEELSLDKLIEDLSIELTVDKE